MNAIKLLTASLLALITITSCDFTEECDYESRLNVHNNWQNYQSVPATNYAIAYDRDGQKHGPAEIKTGANGQADSVSFILPFGNFQAITFTDESFSLHTKVNEESLANINTAYAYVEMETVDLQDGRVLQNPQFPGYFFSSYNIGELNLREPISCAAIQRLHTRFVRFLYNIVYEYNGQPQVKSLTTELTGLATQLKLKDGIGIPESAVSAFSRPEYTEISNSLTGTSKNYYTNQVSALSYLPKTTNFPAVNNTIKVNAYLDNITVRAASLDLTEYFNTFTENFVTIKIDVVIEKTGMHLELAAWELGIWEEFVIK